MCIRDRFQFSGVSDVIDSTCNFLSALTSIPQTILFGRSPAGMNATGDADLELSLIHILRRGAIGWVCVTPKKGFHSLPQRGARHPNKVIKVRSDTVKPCFR